MKKISKNVKRIIIFILAIIIGTMWAFAFITQPWKNNTSKPESQYIGEINATATAYFAWGCFWCMEGIFEKQYGVEWAYSGYTGGEASTATYEQTSAKNTGHREAVRVVYDPDIISYETLVELYWTQINPTDDGGQFNDRGFVYSPAIYYENNKEKDIAEASKKALQDSGRFEEDILVTIEPAKEFFDAEEYHQDYYKKNPIRYKVYTSWSGRRPFIETNWQDRIEEIESSLKKPVAKYNEEELRERLTPLQYKVTQQEGTEPAFHNEYWDNKEAWIYVDIVDGTPLYSSLDKFDSGTGWPSFTKWIDENNLTTHIDTRFFMTRTEVRSKHADSHLGHIFNDAPAELGWIRHCINSASLRFIPVDKLEEEGYEDYVEMFE